MPLSSNSSGTDATTLDPYVTLPPLDSSGGPGPQEGLSTASGKRPGALIPLYASLASLQVLDVSSTFGAIDRGGREANPVVARLVNSPPALMAVKAGSTVAIVYATERLWKRHRVVAVLLMAGLNAGYAGVIARNYTVSRR